MSRFMHDYTFAAHVVKALGGVDALGEVKAPRWKGWSSRAAPSAAVRPWWGWGQLTGSLPLWLNAVAATPLPYVRAPVSTTLLER